MGVCPIGPKGIYANTAAMHGVNSPVDRRDVTNVTMGTCLDEGALLVRGAHGHGLEELLVILRPLLDGQLRHLIFWGGG